MYKILYGIALGVVFGCTTPTTTNVTTQEIKTVTNEDGPTLKYSDASGIRILEEDELKFKDLNRNEKLDPYEDWRLSFDERAKDLASRMSIEQIAGLMLYSSHQAVPAPQGGFMGGTYGGKAFNPEDKSMASWELTDQQKKFLEEDNVRHVLVTSVQSPAVAAKWNNKLQAYTEGDGLGIPISISSDPRNQASVTAEFNAGAGGKISLWPNGLAMGATFDPEIVRGFGEVAAQEYRALGITTALSPQIDLGTEPRWYRIGDIFSESPELTTDMARAYVDGFQTSEGKDEIAHGWGYKSVNAMVKHWAAGGSEEGGRESHWAMGKFNVFPGNNFKTHLKPYEEGVFNLEGGTQFAAAVMPGYSISYDQDTVYGENVGNNFSKYVIDYLLRKELDYDGVVTTDWGVTWDEGESPNEFAGKPWGVEGMNVSERHFKALEAGIDQFGGNNELEPVLEAYQMGVSKYGEKYMRARFEKSAVRLLRNIFQVGLFENPYLDPEESESVVGNPDFMRKGYEAQQKSIVMLKNKDMTLPVKERKKVFIPKRFEPASFGWWNEYSPASLDYPVSLDLVKKDYEVTNVPEEADFALVFIKNPKSAEEGYSEFDAQHGGNGYVPISLQYETYTAQYAREHSIAAGDPVIAPDIKNRSYKNKTSTSTNYTDLVLVQNTFKAMAGKPVIIVVDADKPMVFSEIEKYADAIILGFRVSYNAVLDIVSGKKEPSGLLPLQMPANMKTVEEQQEDVPFDVEPYKDSEGNIYDFGYGLNWSGVITDERTARYKR